MEVKETAACGITQRHFAIEIDPEELPDFFRIVRFAASGAGKFDEEELDDVAGQMSYICGPSIEEEPDDDIDTEEIHWKEWEGSYRLVFSETAGPKLFQIFKDLLEENNEYDQKLAQRLSSEIQELAPSILDNVPVINR
jgi:hypothetical protein